jgi:hypothetical protein
MQTAKDSFFSALSSRLALLDATRTVTIEDVDRPAVVVLENELATTAPTEPNVFYITWGEINRAKASAALPRTLWELDCTISYWTEGSVDLSYQDRGRSLAKLDEQLLAICSPQNTPLQDFSISPPADLAASVFWTLPEFDKLVEDGRKLFRVAALNVFFISE